MNRLELHYRAVEGDVSGIEARLRQGDAVEAVDRAGYTALHFAAQQSQTEAVKILLQAGAPVDVQDAHGNTPLFGAIFDSQGRVETVAELLAAGANPDIANASGGQLGLLQSAWAPTRCWPSWSEQSALTCNVGSGSKVRHTAAWASTAVERLTAQLAA